MNKQPNKCPTHELIRELPEWAKVVRRINDIDIYNMSVFDNILSWTRRIPDVPVIDYFGTVITFGELLEGVRWYVNGLRNIGIGEGQVVTQMKSAVFSPTLRQSGLMF